jgi:hypothetical protein
MCFQNFSIYCGEVYTFEVLVFKQFTVKISVASELADFINRHENLKYHAGGHKTKHRGNYGRSSRFKKQNDGVRNVVVGREWE